MSILDDTFLQKIDGEIRVFKGWTTFFFPDDFLEAAKRERLTPFKFGKLLFDPKVLAQNPAISEPVAVSSAPGFAEAIRDAKSVSENPFVGDTCYLVDFETKKVFYGRNGTWIQIGGKAK